MTRKLTIIALLVGVIVLILGGAKWVAWTPTATKPEGARLSTAEVILLAKQAAEREGADLRRYKEPEAKYTRTDRSWFVFFKGRNNRTTGNHCSVSVDDQTGETRFRGGM